MKQNEYKIEPRMDKHGKPYYRIYLGKVDGKRKYKQFSQFKLADQFIKKMNRDLELKRIGYDAKFGEMLDRKTEILFVMDEADKMKISLSELLRFYKQHGNVFSESISILKSIEIFKEGKEREEVSKDYLKFILPSLNHFKRYIGDDKLIHDITKQDIENYLFIERKDVSPRTKKNSKNNLSILFNYMIKEGYLSLNPCDKITTPKVAKKRPDILSVKDMRIVLDTALKTKHYRECVLMVLNCFCGVRVREAERMKWKNINIKKKSIYIDSDDAKTGMFRYVDIPDNTYRYLVICMENLHIRAKHKEELVLVNAQDKLREFRKTLDIEMPQNVLRHSFGTYHFAAYRNVSETRRLMGHIGNEATFQNHYNNKTITQEQGLKYFDIYPFKKTKDTFVYDRDKLIVD